MKSFLLVALSIFTFGCSSGSNYHHEFAGMNRVHSVGTTDTSSMSAPELHARINKARMEGALTAEEARIAHTQLDVKGHLTAEQIAVINRDRLAARHDYESKKESIDVIRDVSRTASSVVGDVRDIRWTVRSIFR